MAAEALGKTKEAPSEAKEAPSEAEKAEEWAPSDAKRRRAMAKAETMEGKGHSELEMEHLVVAQAQSGHQVQSR